MKFRIIYLLLFFCFSAAAQQNNKVVITNSLSGEPLVNATVKNIADNRIFVTNNLGYVAFNASLPITVQVSSVGYITSTVTIDMQTRILSLMPATNTMQEIIVSCNRTEQKRSEAPIAISTISKQTIEDAKAQRLDFLLNKVSGVFMVSLGNEQHEMSIRQPMTTKSLFLYMEDGIPIRTTGVYNHNALLEMNMASAKSIEIIKGPSSALYGAEAIGGVVNLITQPAPAITEGRLSVQINNEGYKRSDAQVGTTFGKLGVIVSGYYADKKNGPIEYSDFNKAALTLRTDYQIKDGTKWANTFSLVNYYSDMSGSIDSIKFAQRNYTSMQTFTYRKVYALRYKSMLSHDWNNNSNTNVALLFRNNSVLQNPSYFIGSTVNPTKFNGQINDNSFKSYLLCINHTQKLGWLKSKIIAGASVEFSPQSYDAKYISINKDLALNKYVSYDAGAIDSFLSKYKTGILNMAAYVDYEMTPVKNLRLVSAIRYDAFQYYFINNLPTSSSVKTASTINSFKKITPKLGATYNYKSIGFYANYSLGYVPPQLTELYSSSREAPYLLPQTFTNYEVGGWALLFHNKIYADWSLYGLYGKNEIISVKQPNNVSINQNAGSTKHIGVEYGITYKPVNDLSIRISATNAKHSYINSIVKGIDYSGKEVSGAPRFIANAEIIYKPFFIPGCKLSAEWQHQGRYFMDDLDMKTYKGFDIFNARASYAIKGFELWLNVLNAGNLYYSTFSSKNATINGSAAYSYSLGDPREITLGLAYHFGKSFKKNAQ